MTAVEQAEALIRAEFARDKTPDFARVAERISRMVATTLDACAGPDEFGVDRAALLCAQERAVLLRDLATALSLANEVYKNASEAQSDRACFP